MDEPAPRRRWPRRLAILALLLVLLALGWWLAGDRLLFAIGGRLVPRPLGKEATLDALQRVAPEPPAAPIEVAIAADRATSIVRAAGAWFLPPATLRPAQAALGTVTPRDAPFAWRWRFRLAADGEPRVRARLPLAEVQTLLDHGLARHQDAYRLRIALRRAEVHDDAPTSTVPETRTFDLTIAGAVTVEASGRTIALQVERLQVRATVRFVPVAGPPAGMHPEIATEVVALVADNLFLAAVARPALAQGIARALREDERLATLVLPTWAPRDVRVDVVVE